MSAPIRSLEDLNAAYREIFHLEDEAVLPLLTAVILCAKAASLRHVWLYLIGPASGGKTSLLSAFGRVTFAEYISDFTANTLLSGAQSSTHETSLLKRLGSNFVIVVKEFSTILSKSPETQDQLMGQLREVYDGYLRKETGLGKTVEWGSKKQPNRSVFLMASTEAIYKIQEKFSEMGSRGLNYVMRDADRLTPTLVAMKKGKNFDAKVAELQDRVAEYVAREVAAIPAEFPDLDDALLLKLARAADFVTKARSIVLRDYRGEKQLALSAEFPMRVATQLQSVAQLLVHLNRGPADWIERCVMKCAIDCIPKQSLMILKCLAEHPRATAAGVGTKIGYPTERATEWLENLQMHGLVVATKQGSTLYWSLAEDDHRQLLLEQLHLEDESTVLEGDEQGWADYGTGNHAV